MDDRRHLLSSSRLIFLVHVLKSWVEPADEIKQRPLNHRVTCTCKTILLFGRDVTVNTLLSHAPWIMDDCSQSYEYDITELSALC